MAQRTVAFGIDLGTSSTTASHCIVKDELNTKGKLIRTRFRGVNVTEVKDWPGGNKNDATGNICVPTDLIYDRASRELRFWGFEAKQYLDDEDPEIKPESIVHVEHIKLLILDPDEARGTTAASERYRKQRDKLIQELGKQPEDVFQDFMNHAIHHIVTNATRKYINSLGNNKIELILAFPSGWPDHIHTKVAAIGARAMRKAIEAHNLPNMQFDVENVYTVSETLCGVKEWFRDAIAEAAVSNDLDQEGTNLDEFNIGDCFLPCDIGGGTGCITPLKLVSKNPIRVDQLGPTESLEVSGEAIESEFEKWIRSRLAKRDYPGDMERLIGRLCRKFKEEKKDCGLPPRLGSNTWRIPVPRLRANDKKGFESGCMKVDKTRIEACFDPSIQILEKRFEEALREYPGIKAIVFLGQLGGSSEYLRKKMADSPIAKRVKILHSQSGKLNVVKGAMAERLQINDTFVRKFKTVKSYGTLMLMEWYPGSEAHQVFPNAKADGGIFERHDGETWLKVIEWAISKGTTLENGSKEDVSIDSERHFLYPYRERDIWFEDTIVVSDETPPPPQTEGKSYTLWTERHENNQLFEGNDRLDVQQLPFSWDITMSQKVDVDGNIIGAYDADDLVDFLPENKSKGKRNRQRVLHYDPVWVITEMQVKLGVRAKFPNPTGPLTTQLAKQISPILRGESRSKALEKDIEIVAAAAVTPTKESEHRPEGEGRTETLVDVLGPAGAQWVSDLGAEHHQPLPKSPLRPSPPIPPADANARNAQSTSTVASSFIRDGPQSPRPLAQSRLQRISYNLPTPQKSFTALNSSKLDGRRRAGCHTCKVRKKKCDCNYTNDEASGLPACSECKRHGIECHMNEPVWAKDPEQVKVQQLEFKKQVKLGKRKSREESDSSEAFSRGRSSTLVNEFYNSSPPIVQQSIERSVYDDYGDDDSPQTMAALQPKRRRWTAIRGGKNGYRNFRH